jgi:NCAIR mutase (PurE)-related protein
MLFERPVAALFFLGVLLEPQSLESLLKAVSSGELSVEEAEAQLRAGELAEKDMVYATVDLQRQARTGFPEVVYGASKSPEQIAGILNRLNQAGQNAFATRVDKAKAKAILLQIPDARYAEVARILHKEVSPIEAQGQGEIGVICAGTSDLPVAEEAAVVAELLGNKVRRITDVGVAGVHRLLRHADALQSCRVLVVVAGMEGALPSVVAGLTNRPVIAVPTSVGYGTSFGGLTALLAMLNSCSTGISVVNIDNGFGAAYQAALINRLQ